MDCGLVQFGFDQSVGQQRPAQTKTVVGFLLPHLSGGDYMVILLDQYITDVGWTSDFGASLCPVRTAFDSLDLIGLLILLISDLLFNRSFDS